MAISGTGTATDPYIPTTFADFKTCVGQTGVYVCLMQDIDVSKDSIYKTGITEPLTISCRYVYGTAMTYSSTTAYAQDDKCTYNDGEHGLCTYTCIQPCTGIDVTNTEYWTRGGNPTKKITGLVITAVLCFRFNQSSNDIDMSNLFFESCVWDKTQNNEMFSNTAGRDVTINDCAFSMFYNQHDYNALICTSSAFKFNRCSLYVRYPGNFISAGVTYSNRINTDSYFNNCTLDIENVGICGDNGYTPFTGGEGRFVNSSLRVTAYITLSSNSRYFTHTSTGSFAAITILGVRGDGLSCLIYPYGAYMHGTNIIDKDVVGQATLGTSVNLIQGTTEQCKDKDWLTSQGFFTS